MNTIPVIIPAYQPDDRLIGLLRKLDEEDIGPVYLVDDGSGPAYGGIFIRSAAIIRRLGGRTLVHEVNRGKGRALKTAFGYILQHDPAAIAAVTADSDGQHNAGCIQKMIAAISSNPEALVLGVRRFNLEGVPWKSRWGNTITEKVFTYVAGVHVSDTQTGLRGIPRSFMPQLVELKGERFEFEMRMLLEAAGRMPLVEVPIETIYDSAENHQTHFNPFRDSVKIYRILAERFFKFLFSSLSSSVLDLAVFKLLCLLLKARLPGCYAALATVGARVLSASYNYGVNYKLVFKSSADPVRAAAKYVVLAAVQMGCSAALITGALALWPTGPELVLKAIIDTILFFISYKIQQKLVFRKQ